VLFIGEHTFKEQGRIIAERMKVTALDSSCPPISTVICASFSNANPAPFFIRQPATSVMEHLLQSSIRLGPRRKSTSLSVYALES
jgi:hypothetical protein